MTLALALSAHEPKGRVLLVEDDPSQTRLMTVWLEACDYEVSVAEDSDTAREMLRRGIWDVVLLDVALPDGSGLELIDSAKAAPVCTPVIMMTAHDRVEFAIDALRRGADDYLRKPLTRGKLLGAVSRVIGQIRENHQPRKTILAVGAMPGDVEAGCGGTLLRYRQGGDCVYLLTATGGEQTGVRSSLQTELVRAGIRMDARVIVESMDHGRLDQQGPGLVKMLARMISSLGVSVVYGPSRCDEASDNRALHDALMVAARDVPEVYCYQGSTTTPGFSPNRFVDVSAVFGGKIDVLKAYDSRWGKSGLDADALKATAMYWGRYAGGCLVEPLEVVREVS